jgi:uncharacterized protein YifN (PemK superfamily)
MAIKYAPQIGSIILCDYRGSIAPEMNKKRPVVVIANVSHRLCVVVPLSTTQPLDIEPWHKLVLTTDPLPEPYNATTHWAKCDMIYTASFDRLTLPFKGKDAQGKRIYDIKQVSADELRQIKEGILSVVSP